MREGKDAKRNCEEKYGVRCRKRWKEHRNEERLITEKGKKYKKENKNLRERWRKVKNGYQLRKERIKKTEENTYIDHRKRWRNGKREKMQDTSNDYRERYEKGESNGKTDNENYDYR